MPRLKRDITMVQEDHIATRILNGSDDRLLDTRHINPWSPPTNEIRDILQYTGFWDVSQIGRMELNKSLITALVERWRPETHTFHFSCGEVTITLEDVAILFGLRTHGDVVTGITCTNPEVLRQQCFEMFGSAPHLEQMDHYTINLGWLQQFFDGLQVTQDNIIIRARAYLLCLIGTVVVPDKSTHNVHGKYLQLLGDLESFARLSWGSACLAVLYRNLDRATRIKTRQIGGPLMLLQSWAWTRLPHLAPIPTPLTDNSFPLAKIWRNPSHLQQGVVGDHITVRFMLDDLTTEQFQWQPYRHDAIQALIPGIIWNTRMEWRWKVPLICFEVLEWHAPNRVKRQFGYFQDIPEIHPNLGLSHNLDLRSKEEYTNWALKHKQWIMLWKGRRSFLFDGQQLVGEPIDYNPIEEYINWYRTNVFVPLRLIPNNEDEPPPHLPPPPPPVPGEHSEYDPMHSPYSQGYSAIVLASSFE